VRVPTHEDGSCLFWEFATDHYDIGFGLYFEWTVDNSNQVSVHVGESSDDEDEENGELMSSFAIFTAFSFLTETKILKGFYNLLHFLLVHNQI